MNQRIPDLGKSRLFFGPSEFTPFARSLSASERVVYARSIVNEVPVKVPRGEAEVLLFST